MKKKLFSSLSIFFPFFNDEGTVSIQLNKAYEIGKILTDDLQVIALHGGASQDRTWEKILEMKKIYPDLKIVDKKDNTEGYAVIKYGFQACEKDYIFYTDGDYQYHLEEDLIPLAKEMISKGADVANGYKSSRSDNPARIFLGKLYALVSQFVFELPIRDTDCDFRIIKKSYLDKVKLVSKNASILPELIKKLQLLGASFVEIPVGHYSRIYGNSNYRLPSLISEKILGDFSLYFQMRKIKAIRDRVRVVRFALVGLVCFILQILIFNFLIILLDLNRALAAFLSDQFPIVVSFILNNSFTFQGERISIKMKSFIKFVKFYSVVVFSTLIQATTVFIGTLVFGDSYISSNFFLVLGLFLAFIWNYILQSRLVWKQDSVKIKHD